MATSEPNAPPSADKPLSPQEITRMVASTLLDREGIHLPASVIRAFGAIIAAVMVDHQSLDPARVERIAVAAITPASVASVLREVGFSDNEIARHLLDQEPDQ